MQVGVRELKGHLSQYLAAARKGEVVTVTDRGEPIARIIPADDSERTRKWAELIASGTVHWSGKAAKWDRPTIRLRGPGPTLADIVIANRR